MTDFTVNSLATHEAFQALMSAPARSVKLFVEAATVLKEFAGAISDSDSGHLYHIFRKHNLLILILGSDGYFAFLKEEDLEIVTEPLRDLLGDAMREWDKDALPKIRTNLALIVSVLSNLRDETDVGPSRGDALSGPSPNDQPENTDPGAPSANEWDEASTTPITPRSSPAATDTPDVEATDPMKKTSSEAPKTEPPSQEAVSPSVNSRLGTIIGDIVRARLEAAPPPAATVPATGAPAPVKIEGRTWSPVNSAGTAMPTFLPPADTPAQETPMTNGSEGDTTRRDTYPPRPVKKKTNWLRFLLLLALALMAGVCAVLLANWLIAVATTTAPATTTSSAPAATSASSSSTPLDCTHVISTEGDLDGDDVKEPYVIIPLRGGAATVSVAGITAKDGVCRWGDSTRSEITVDRFQAFLNEFRVAYRANRSAHGSRMTKPVESFRYTVRCDKGSGTFDDCFTL